MDYSSLSMDVFIKRILSNEEMCPCLLIGKYVNEFKKIYTGRIITIYTLDSVRKLIESYYGLRDITGGFMVLEGIGYLSSSGQNSMLKFIEESKVPIILLSYNDKISPIIMSRMKIVVKRWDPVKGLKFVRPRDAFRSVRDKKEKDKDFKESQEIQYLADNCPQAYSLRVLSGDPYDSISERIRDILVSI